MTDWTRDELDKIGKAEELQVAALKSDGTLRKLVIIWVVRVGDELYIRSVKGDKGGWFRGTQTRHEGHIRAGGVNKDVTFVDVSDAGEIERVDEAYRSKYMKRYKASTESMLTSVARPATLKIVPRGVK